MAQATKQTKVAPDTLAPGRVKGKTLMEQYGTKSAAIRALSAAGLERGDIVREFKKDGVDILYQHVRNVLITPVKSKAKTAPASKE